MITAEKLMLTHARLSAAASRLGLRAAVSIHRTERGVLVCGQDWPLTSGDARALLREANAAGVTRVGTDTCAWVGLVRGAPVQVAALPAMAEVSR